MSLKIAALEALGADVVLTEPLATSLKTYDRLPYVFVRVALSDGTVGVGEARESIQITGERGDTIIRTINAVLADAVAGMHPSDLQGIHAAMDRSIVGNTAAKSAVDMAVHDAVGKAYGISAQLVMAGGAGARLPTSKAISVGPIEQMVAQAEHSVQAGFGTLKLKTGINAVSERLAVSAIRAAVGPDVYLKLDANQGWGLQEASAFLSSVEKFDIQMVEQPLPAWDLAGHAALRARTPIPIMLDESVHSPHDATRAIDAGACDYLNIKLVKTGGLYPALKLVAVAQSAGVTCQIGSLDTTIGSAAAIHLARARPDTIRFVEINGPTRLERDFATGYHFSEGTVWVDNAPGLGVLPDWAAIGFGPEAVAKEPVEP